MLSADLFNIYIDDMIQLLEKAGFKPLSYVDDLPGICDGDENLINAIDIYEKWAGINDIQVNKKRSGIIIIQNQSSNQEQIRGYPVKNLY